jgi:hypothetical protein
MKKLLVEKKTQKELVTQKRIDTLYSRASQHIDQARQSIQRSIDTNMIKAYWMIGHEIVQEEQHGDERAEYGHAILKGLSMRLQKKYKKGFSVDLLEKARKFYITSQVNIRKTKSATLSRKSKPLRLTANLSWSHMRYIVPAKDFDYAIK